MRSLFLFLWRYNFFILFLVMETVCFFLIARNSNFHRASYINSTNAVAAKVNGAVSAITEYINLSKANEALSRENAAMHTLMPGAYYIDSVLKQLVVDTVHRQQYIFVTAKVINNSVNRRNNYLTLNKGGMQGVRPEMGVVCAEGLVGIVKDTSAHFSSVLSLLHKDARISAKVKKSGYIGSLVWDGFDFRHALLKDIALHVKLAKGDTIVTSSFSSIFPEGIMIGTVEDFEAKEGDNFYSINVRLSTDFSNLSSVYIVENVLKEEQHKLEEKQADDR
jgi:rod shape-determining protein MreC